MTCLNIKQENNRVHKYSDKINRKMTWKNLKVINKNFNSFLEELFQKIRLKLSNYMTILNKTLITHTN